MKLLEPTLQGLAHFGKSDIVTLQCIAAIADTVFYIPEFGTGYAALRWCIENVIPLEVLEPYSKQAAVVRYEDLSSNINLFYDLCDAFNLELISNLKQHFKQPSSKTHPASAWLRQGDKKNMLTYIDISKINRILDVFKTQLYSRRY